MLHELSYGYWVSLCTLRLNRQLAFLPNSRLHVAKGNRTERIWKDQSWMLNLWGLVKSMEHWNSMWPCQINQLKYSCYLWPFKSWCPICKFRKSYPDWTKNASTALWSLHAIHPRRGGATKTTPHRGQEFHQSLVNYIKSTYSWWKNSLDWNTKFHRGLELK